MSKQLKHWHERSIYWHELRTLVKLSMLVTKHCVRDSDDMDRLRFGDADEQLGYAIRA
jgi:hypothetical protein